MMGSVAKSNEEIQTVEVSSFDYVTLTFVLFSIGIGIWFVKTRQSSLPRRGYLDPAITPIMAVVLCFAMLVLASIGAWWGASQVVEDSIQKDAWMFGASMAAQIPVVLMYVYLRQKSSSRRILPVSIISFAVFVPMTFAVAGVAHLIFVKIGLEESTDIGHVTLEKLATEPWGTSSWVVAICATIGAGIIEEVMYRGFILPAFATVLGSKTLWRAIVATSIFFAIMHTGAAQPSAMLGLFVFSVGLCWARVKSGGVLAPILIHIVFNAMNIAIVYSTKI